MSAWTSRPTIGGEEDPDDRTAPAMAACPRVCAPTEYVATIIAMTTVIGPSSGLDQRDDGRDDGEAEHEERRLAAARRATPPARIAASRASGLADRRGHDRLVVATDADLRGLQPDRDDQRDRQQAIPVPSQEPRWRSRPKASARRARPPHSGE